MHRRFIKETKGVALKVFERLQVHSCLENQDTKTEGCSLSYSEHVHSHEARDSLESVAKHWSHQHRKQFLLVIKQSPLRKSLGAEVSAWAAFWWPLIKEPSNSTPSCKPCKSFAPFSELRAAFICMFLSFFPQPVLGKMIHDDPKRLRWFVLGWRNQQLVK